MRYCLLGVMLVASFGFTGQLPAAEPSAIIPQTTAEKHGLKRAWITQVELDRSRARVNAMVLHGDTLFVQSNRAMVHAIHAETGQTLWARRIGRADRPSMTPGVNKDLIAIVNGSRLYVCNRHNGDVLYENDVDGAPGGGAGLSEQRAYVPMVDGMVKSFRLKPEVDAAKELGIVEDLSTEEQRAAAEEERRENLRLHLGYIPVLNCMSYGRALVQPLAARQNAVEEFVVWPTDKGFLYVGRVDRGDEDRFTVKFRIKAEGAIAAQPTYLPPDPNIEGDSGIILCTARDGLVYAVREDGGGQVRWRFSTGEPVVQPAVMIEPRVFIATQLGGMFCVDLETGSEIWWAPKVVQFVAASKDRVYAADRVGRIHVLNIKTGTRLDTLPTTGSPLQLLNQETDRMYLATSTGLVQCLHEQELTRPIRHSEDRKEGIRRVQEAEQMGVDELQQPVAPVAQPGRPIDPLEGDAGDPFGGDQAPFGEAPRNNGANDGADDPFGADGANLNDPMGEDPFGQ